jgi:hypothetical protein
MRATYFLRADKYHCQRLKEYLYTEVAHEKLIYPCIPGDIVSNWNEIDVMGERTVYEGKQAAWMQSVLR